MTYLSERERLLIYRWLAVWYNKYEIAKKLWRSNTTIGRDIEHNRNNNLEYDPIKAENIYRDRRKITNKAHAYHSRERWNNEHTNGTIRKWLLKWCDFSNITDEEIIALQTKINNKTKKDTQIPHSLLTFS